MPALRLLRPFVLAFVCSFLLGSRLVRAQDFSIIVLPDTQNEAQFFPQVFNAQTKWIADNAGDLGIKMVLGVGDIVNDGAQTAQQQNADAAIRVLDNEGVPYMLAIGNHDYDGANPKLSRSATGFNQWFGPTRYAAKPYYKGNFPSGSNENFYGVLTINEKQYLFLILEYRPRSASLDWADSILNANSDKEAIIVTHSYERTNGTREDACDTQDMPLGNAYGEQMWQRFRKHANVIMVLNGHFTGGTVNYRSDVGDNGNLVNQIFADMQDFPNGGDGWLEIITFHPASNSISVETYSPYLNQFMTGATQQFTIPYHNPNPQTGTGKIAGRVRNASGCAAARGVTVTAGAAYAVTASDGSYNMSLGPGSYSVTASGTGWNSGTQSELVSDSLTTQLDFYLSSTGSCTLSTVSPSVTICTPANNAAVGSPVSVTAGTTDSNTVSFIQLYVDGKAVTTQSGGTLNTSTPLTDGTHRLTVQAKDSAGLVFKQTISVTAGSSPSPTPTPTPTPSPTPSPSPSPTPGTCTPGSTSPSVTICTPANNATVTSPVNVLAVTTDSRAVSFIQLYVDGKAVTTQNGGTLNMSTPLTDGTHRLTVQAKDSAGLIFKQTISVTAGSSPSPSPTPTPTPSPSPTPGTCTAGNTSPSVTICSPLNNSTVTSPVQVVAATRDSVEVSFVQIYLDGKAILTSSGGTLDTSVAMAAGAHRLTVQAKDNAGVIFKQTVSITCSDDQRSLRPAPDSPLQPGTRGWTISSAPKTSRALIFLEPIYAESRIHTGLGARLFPWRQAGRRMSG